MSKEHLGLALCAVGAIPLAIAFIKFFVIGYYPDELVPFAIIGVVGALVCFVGSKIFQAGRLES